VESMIGLYYVHGGLAMSARLLEELDLVAGMANLIGCRFVQPPRKNGGGGDDPRATAPRLAEVEKIIGYTFARKDVLVEALTHSSYKSSEVLSYQRLEFLGDAVMGHVVLKGFYERYEDLDPAQLTLIREPALSNELFGRVVVDFGLHKYLWHDSALLERDVRATVAAFEAETDDEDVCDTMAVPKVLGDILEAIVGAVVVDQDMTLDAVEPIVDRLMSKALQRFANPETLAQHPVTKMSQALQAQYGAGPEFVYASVAAPGPAGADAILCTIRVAGVDIAAARGMSRRKAKRSAAQVALERMGPPGGASGERVAE
jgi:endoribonuclease Dicer